MKTDVNDGKKLFRKLGTCSRTFFYIINREFDNLKENEERAADPLAGGINKLGYQCGMLWGASLAVGAEAYRRSENLDHAIGVAIKATQHVMESFLTRADSIDCYDITDCDWTNKLSVAKHFFSGNFLSCFNLAQEWAPEAVQAAIDGLSLDTGDLPEVPVSCASEVVKRMGGSDEEMVMVAGFAGGLGLHGNACGALSAAIWIDALKWCKNNDKSAFKNSNAEEFIEKFYAVTDYEILCNKITGTEFKSVAGHTDYIKNGGCDRLIVTLGQL